MVDFLTHYFRTDAGPFLTVSALPDAEAIAIMERLCDDTPYGARFKDPARYLNDRRETERWVRAAFEAKGARPRDLYPVSMVLGSSKWLAAAGPDPAKHGEVRLPLALLTEDDVSFTFPDSMVSRWLSLERPVEYYVPGLHGVVFTLPEIRAVVERRGMPEAGWTANLPAGMGGYVEAQVWNRQILDAFVERR